MNYNKGQLGQIAKQYGFVRDTFEKVLRLKEILTYLNTNEYLHEHLALKGGTAINMTIFNLPRLSVDLDLDFTPNLPLKDMENINPSQAAVQGIALLTSLKKMFMYTTEIEQELFGKSGKFIVKQVYCQYQNKVINIVHETINSLNNVIECIYLNKVIDISEITDIKRILEEAGEQMRDVIFDVAKEASYEQIEDLFSQFVDVFAQYVDASGIMAVS